MSNVNPRRAILKKLIAIASPSSAKLAEILRRPSRKGDAMAVAIDEVNL